MTLEEIKIILREHKDEFFRKYGVEEIGIFGSRVRGEQRKDSDIDILVEFSPSARISLLEFIQLELYLSELLGGKVDLVEKKALKPRIGKHILAEVVNL